MTSKTVVTTFHKKGYDVYAKNMINSFLNNWPSDIKLMVYPEDHDIEERADNLEIYPLHETSPELVAFKNRWKDDPKARGEVPTGPKNKKGKQPGIGFRWDAIRFSHKVYSVFHAAKNCNTDILFWMDADMLCHSPITHEFIDKMMPDGIGLGYLGREKKFSECGLYAMNLRDSRTLEFLEEFQRNYDSGDLFKMQEWNDCWVFDESRSTIQQRHRKWNQYNWSQGLITGEGHPLINSAWGAYLDHLKGNRKELGKSQKKDLIVKRSENYWSTI